MDTCQAGSPHSGYREPRGKPHLCIRLGTRADAPPFRSGRRASLGRLAPRALSNHASDARRETTSNSAVGAVAATAAASARSARRRTAC
eukprot:352249-Chlamydomonas_euryale.AAC.26